jgi:putative peptidoglycan lipid II flippase
MTDETPPAGGKPAGPQRRGGAAALVAGGILLSRLLGLLREILRAKYLGATSSIVADAFSAAIRIPNLLQNLFGEGALSASFIPVYANLLARDEREEAGRVAGAVAAILGLAMAVLVLLGVWLAPHLIPLIAYGFTGEKRRLTVLMTQILFPGAGLFVLSAWCLGVQNSHRKFLLSYAAPALWNVAMIAALVAYGRRQPPVDLAITLAWASVVGAALQFLVQLPTAVRLVPHLRLRLDLSRASVRRVLRNFGPVGFSRGVVQLSAYVDQWISSFLPGVMSMLSFAQNVSYLPVSLFGMAVSAAELPEMSSVVGTASETAAHLRGRLDGGLRRIAFFVIPSAVAFVILGDVIVGALFQRGRFNQTDTLFTWGILAGSSVGLLASTLGRLYSSAYYALHDTRTPLGFAVVRVALTMVLGLVCALHVPHWLGVDPHWGGAGLTASAGVAGWVEFALLRSRLNRRIGRTGLPARYLAILWTVALGAAATAYALKRALPPMGHVAVATLVLGLFGLLYLGGTAAFRVPEVEAIWRRLRRRR